MNNSIRVLQVSTTDMIGGADKIAYNLHRAYQIRGHLSWLTVGRKFTNNPGILPIPNGAYRSIWTRIWLNIAKAKGAWRLQRWLHWIGQPGRLMKIRQGHEDFEFPGTWRILDLLSEQPDIIHCHNLHGGYFDLRALPWLSERVPVILTLHDGWLFSGHCAHSFDCERWKTGCGYCPDLTIYPAVGRDATAYNWRRKHEIYTQARLYVATPSQWLMQKVKQSILEPAIVEARVVPNGVDLSIFHPYNKDNKRAVRAALGISQDTKVLLFTACGVRQNNFKDYQTVQAAVAQVAERLYNKDILFINLGGDAPEKLSGKAKVCFIPYQMDPEAVVRYYQAADVYVHAARADTFPTSILEATACGLPVVATAVGGIPEQVKSLRISDSGLGTANCKLNSHHLDEATGLLVPPGDSEAMAQAILVQLNNEKLRNRLGVNAAQDARQRFNLERQVKTYLEWYQTIAECKNDNRDLRNIKSSVMRGNL